MLSLGNISFSEFLYFFLFLKQFFFIFFFFIFTYSSSSFFIIFFTYLLLLLLLLPILFLLLPLSWAWRSGPTCSSVALTHNVAVSPSVPAEIWMPSSDQAAKVSHATPCSQDPLPLLPLLPVLPTPRYHRHDYQRFHWYLPPIPYHRYSLSTTTTSFLSSSSYFTSSSAYFFTYFFSSSSSCSFTSSPAAPSSTTTFSTSSATSFFYSSSISSPTKGRIFCFLLLSSLENHPVAAYIFATRDAERLRTVGRYCLRREVEGGGMRYGRGGGGG